MAPRVDQQRDDDTRVSFEEVEHPATDGGEREDTQWLIRHYADLVERYPMSWIAVQNKRVVGHGTTPNQAMDDALERLGETDQRPNDEPYTDSRHAKNAPHLYFLERSADWFLEH